MSKHWLLESGVLETMHQDFKQPSAQELLSFESEYQAIDGIPRGMSVAGDVAAIKIHGVLTDTPNFMARFFGSGNTVYSDIRAALAIAENDPTIKTIELDVDSPGGAASTEWVATMDAIKNASKPVRATAATAASAAYGLASQAGEIVAKNRLSRFGSVGVIMSMRLDDGVVSVTSSNAPNKNPDPKTESGERAIKEHIDAIENIFINSVADGRDTTPDTVKADFGRGGMLLAEAALQNNMIDSVADATNTKPAVSGNTKTEAVKMDLNELKASHPETFQAALNEGVTQERERVNAHLILGKGSGDMETAIKAVSEGSELTPTIQATYMAAGMNKNSTDARQTDDAAAAAALNGTAPDAAEAKDTEMCAMLAEELGE